MASLKSNIRNIVLFVVIGLVLVFVYMTFIKGDGGETPNLVGTTVDTSTATGGSTAKNQVKEAEIARDFLALLLSVKNITLNDAIFTDVAFTSLRDSSILLIPDGNEGRPNPFAPIGTDALYTPPPASPATTSNAGTKASTSGIEEIDLGFNLDFETDLDLAGESLAN